MWRTLKYQAVLLVALVAYPASAEDGIHPWMMHIAPLPVTAETYTPPAWLYQCPVVTASVANVGTTSSCLPAAAPETASIDLVLDQSALRQLQQINEEINAGLVTGGRAEAIAAAILKKERLQAIGWPEMVLDYAIVELETAETSDDNDHLVLLACFNLRAFVLDVDMDDVLPWQYSPYRFYGVEKYPGVWRAVADVRDDPLAMAIEWYER